MPPDSRARLVLAAEALGVALSTNQFDALLGHLSLLTKWNRVYNLTAVRDPVDMLGQHLVDSLAIVPALSRHLDEAEKVTAKVLDVGSGAGFPGVVLCIALPNLEVTCVDTVGKKASFIRQVAAELGLHNLRAEHARIEQLKPMMCDLITSRAFASLADFARLTQRHLVPGGAWMAMKGKRPLDEIAALPPTVTVFHVEPLTVPGLDAERCLVWMHPSADSPGSRVSIGSAG